MFQLYKARVQRIPFKQGFFKFLDVDSEAVSKMSHIQRAIEKDQSR
jgi:hypothetical protein